MSGEQHLGWEALERIRTDEASGEEYAHLASCAACRDALADLERLASRFKESLNAAGDAIPAVREDAILGAARERAAAIAGHKLVRLPWWKQKSTMALAASLVVAGSATYLTHLTRDEASPRSEAKQAARDELDSGRAAAPAQKPSSAPSSAPAAREPEYSIFRSPTAEPPARTNEAVGQKKEDVGRLDGELGQPPPQPVDTLGKTVSAPHSDVKERPEPAGSRALGFERSEEKGDATKSKDANLAARDLAAAPPPPASTMTAAPAAPAARAPVDEPAKPAPQTSPAAPSAALLADRRAGSLEEQAVAPAAPVGGVAGGAAAGAIGAELRAEPRPAEADDKLAAALGEREQVQRAKLAWLPPRPGLWALSQGETRDVTEPRPLPLVSTEIEVRVGDTVARRMLQRFTNPSGQPIIATYSIGLAPGERGADLSLTIGSTEVARQLSEDMTHVRMWENLPIAGGTIDLTTLSPPRPLEGAASGSVRVRIPVPPPPPQSTDDPPKLAIRLEPAQGFRIGQPAAAGLAIKGHPLGSGAWDLTLPPTLGVKEDILELDVPIVRTAR